jgi:tetratricopeptide (TPR) repeat protein
VARALAPRGEKLVTGLWAMTVIGSAQALGTVHVPVLLVVASVGLLACIVCYRGRLVHGWRVPAPALVMWALSGYTLLQALPLPMTVVAILAPANADVWREAVAPFREASPRWAAISLDPGASIVEALKWLLYGAGFAVAAAIGARRGAHWGAVVVLASGVLVAVSSLAHRLAGAVSVYGIYEPVGEFAREKIGPLLNPNNLSGYLNIGIFSGFGLLVMRRPPIPRWLIGLGVAMQLGGLLEAGSRGGLISLVCGIIALAIVLSTARALLDPSLADPRTVRWGLAIVIAGGAGLALLAVAHKGLDALGDRNIEKIKLLSWAKPMIAQHPWFGIGRGAFESVFPEYRTAPNNLIYSHPENFIAQWVSEWGIPVAVAALVLFMISLRPRALGVGREAVAIGAFAALIVLLVQNLVDLGLEVPAIPVAVLTTLGTCWGAAHAAGTRTDYAVGAWPVRMAWGLRFCSLALVAAVALVGRATVGDDRRRIQEALASSDLRDAEVRVRLRSERRTAMLRHPAEPYFPRVGAIIAWRGGDQDPLPWIDRALERSLTSGRTHYLLARILTGWKRDAQALLELRLAAEYEPELAKHVARAALDVARDPEQLLRVIPNREGGTGVLRAMIPLFEGPELGPIREPFLHLAIGRFPDVPAPRIALVSGLLEAMEQEGKAGRCADEERSKCVALIEQHLPKIARLLPDTPEAVELKARLLMVQGDPDAAVKVLAGQCERFRASRRCTRLRLKAAARAKSAPTMVEAARAVIATGCQTAAACAETYESLGDAMASAGNWNQARGYYQRAVQEEPSAQRWLKVASIASRMGAHLEAADALSRVARERGDDPTIRARIDAERRAAWLRQGLSAGGTTGPK